MKKVLFILFLFAFFYCNAQDNIKVSGYGSMTDLPLHSMRGEAIYHWEFSQFSKNTTLEIVLWDFKDSLSGVSKMVLFRELLSIKENPRIDVMVQNNKEGALEICCNYIGKFFSVHPLKSDVKVTPYVIKSLPKTMDKVVPIILFVGDIQKIDESILWKITNLKEFDIHNNKPVLEELLSQSHSFKILTYQLTEK